MSGYLKRREPDTAQKKLLVRVIQSLKRVAYTEFSVLIIMKIEYFFYLF